MTDLVTDLDGEWSTIRLTRPIRGRGRRSCEATRRSWPLLVQNCVSRHQPATRPPDTACPARCEAKLLVARRISAGIPLQILRLVSPRTILRWWDLAVVRERRVTTDVLAEMSRDGPG